jgi:hypothetical protein
MGERLRLYQKHHNATLSEGNSNLVMIFVSPILLTLLCLTATCKNVKAQSSLEASTGTPRQTDTQTRDKRTPEHRDTNQNSLMPVTRFPSSLSQQSPSTPALIGGTSYGNQISLNNRILPGAWLQQRTKTGALSIHLSDGAVRQLFGIDLLNTSNPARQPIQWFSSDTKPQTFTSLLTAGYRYLDITNFAKTAQWQMQANGKTLFITTPSAKVININQDKQPLGDRIMINLDRPTPWQMRQGLPITKPQILPLDPLEPDTSTVKPTSPPNREWIITLDGIANPPLIERYTSSRQIQENQSITPITPSSPDTLIQQIEVVNNQTIVRLSVPFGLAPLVSTVPNPNRLLIQIRPDAMVAKNITWAPGLRWRQQFVNLGQERFPVVWLEINPRTSGIKLRPIQTTTNTLIGTAPLIQTAQQDLAVAAINGGFFNRNNQLPLGAIRRDGQWLSSPILNRGAIAWNDSGQFYIGRLNLLETLIGSNNVQLPILTLNSGYVQSGIARYTPAWGTTYTPLTDNEIILVVQKNQVVNQLTGGTAGEIAIPIPQNGYLLTLRGNATNNAAALPIGSSLRMTSSTAPADFSRYPHILGAGPLLLQNRQIVLDAKAEKFSTAFIAQKAIRSGICTTTTGNVMIAAVHNRAGGAGPTLAEHAQLMQLLGCVNALNLDGGSSTSLYLGGQLLDRSPNTAARVHNGIGIFLEPLR